MEHATLLDRLAEADVLAPAGDDSVRVTDEFTARVADVESDFADEDEPVAGALHAGISDRADRLLAVADDDPTVVAQYCVLAGRLPDLAHDSLVRLALLVDRLDAVADPPAGVPDGFLPVSGPRFVTAVELTGVGVGYVYQPDCDPCEAVRESLERLGPGAVEDGRGDGAGENGDDGQEGDALALLAVDGSRWPDLLFDRLDVRGAPTTLFVRDGAVDARLESAQPHDTYEQELAATLAQAREENQPEPTGRTDE